MEQTKPKRYYSVDYFKYFCALLIVVIHLKPLKYFSDTLSDFSINGIARIGVPFFFISSGFFLSKKLYAKKSVIKTYLLKLLAVYTFWSAVYATRLILIEIKNKSLTLSFLKALIIKYFLYGISEHLWFCISLLISALLLWLIHKIRLQKYTFLFSLILITAACVFLTYVKTVTKVFPALEGLSFEHCFWLFRLLVFGPCFVFLGDFICAKEEKILSLKNKLYYIFGAALIIHIAEKSFNYRHGDNLLINFSLYLLVMSIFFLLIKNPGKDGAGVSIYARNASAFTYYSHIIVLEAVGYLSDSYLIKYISVVLITLILSIILTKINNKKLNYVLM
ncbi:MAG: acyltransferase family protein [Eubacterium sp.]|nr:acyltransferase family protein [Eubacterium sp.]